MLMYWVSNGIIYGWQVPKQKKSSPHSLLIIPFFKLFLIQYYNKNLHLQWKEVNILNINLLNGLRNSNLHSSILNVPVRVRIISRETSVLAVDVMKNWKLGIGSVET